jgi:hypothetical protein
MRRALALAATLALVGAAPAPAAVSRSEALKIARSTVRPDATNASKLYGFRLPLARGSVVGEGGIPTRRLRRAKRSGSKLTARVPMLRLRRPAWLFWFDQAPGAGFQHPSIIVLVDAKTGGVRRRAISWWPVVNRRRLLPPGVRRARAAPVPPIAWRASIVPGLRNDCIVTIGDRSDPYFTKALAAMTRLGQAIGARVIPVQRVGQLGPKIDEAIRGDPPCTDVMIYIAGHGWGPIGTDVKTSDGLPVAQSEQARVTIKSTVGGGATPRVVEELLDFADVKKLIHDRPQVTFKLVVESCFAGRWTLLMAEPNLRIAVASSRATEVTFLAVTDPRPGTQSGGELTFTGGEQGAPDGPDDPPPFTKGFVQAVTEWSDSPGERSKGEDLGEAAGYAGTHHHNRAEDLGWVKPQTDDRTDQRPHAPPPGQQQPPPQPPGQVAYEVRVDGSYRHIGPGSSEVCWDVGTSPPRPNAEVTIRTTGPGVTGGGSQSVRTGDDGKVRVRVAINAFGRYDSTADVVAADGAARSGAGSVTVGEAQGTCPPP